MIRLFFDTPLECLTPNSDNYSAYHLYIVLLPKVSKEVHKDVISSLRGKNIFAHVHYIPIHLQPYYQQLGFKQGEFRFAEEYYQRAVSLPLYPKLTQEEQVYVINTIKAELAKLAQ
jgi:dTDP-4-amino-4,6-dideoxygalactose transaminase